MNGLNIREGFNIVEVVKYLREEHHCYMNEEEFKEITMIMNRNGKEYSSESFKNHKNETIYLVKVDSKLNK